MRPDHVAAALERIREIAPNVDTRPGSVLRTLIEAAASEAGPIPDAGIGRLDLSEEYAQIERQIFRGLAIPQEHLSGTPRIRGQTHHAMFVDEAWATPAQDGLSQRSLDIARARQEIQAEEDRLIFEALDRAASQRAPIWAQEYAGTFATERVETPTIPLQSNPTISIDDIRQRRFNLMGRNPCGEIPLSEPMTLEAMQKVALIVRKTAWERVLAVEELEDFPV